MDADETLTALKKASADVILNTLKESAIRVFDSERKALRYQYEAKAAKEQGLQMLLRLKQMSDSKDSEAVVLYWNQQRKIKELEIQLQETEDRKRIAEMGSWIQENKVEELELQLTEAEDIVNDLREEVSQLEAQLRAIKKRKLQQQGEYCYYIEDTSNVNGITDSQSATQINLPHLNKVASEIDSQAIETSDSENTSNNGEVIIHESGALQISSPSVIDLKTKPVETFVDIDQAIDNKIIKYTFQRKRKNDYKRNDRRATI